MCVGFRHGLNQKLRGAETEQKSARNLEGAITNGTFRGSKVSDAGGGGLSFTFPSPLDAVDEFEAVLELREVSEQHFGVFTCEARNGVGAKAAVDIRLQAPSKVPKLTNGRAFDQSMPLFVFPFSVVLKRRFRPGLFSPAPLGLWSDGAPPSTAVIGNSSSWNIGSWTRTKERPAETDKRTLFSSQRTIGRQWLFTGNKVSKPRGCFAHKPVPM